MGIVVVVVGGSWWSSWWSWSSGGRPEAAWRRDGGWAVGRGGLGQLERRPVDRAFPGRRSRAPRFAVRADVARRVGGDEHAGDGDDGEHQAEERDPTTRCHRRVPWIQPDTAGAIVATSRCSRANALPSGADRRLAGPVRRGARRPRRRGPRGAGREPRRRRRTHDHLADAVAVEADHRDPVTPSPRHRPAGRRPRGRSTRTPPRAPRTSDGESICPRKSTWPSRPRCRISCRAARTRVNQVGAAHPHEP